MATTPEFNYRKLVGPELAKFIQQEGTSTLSVIIELSIEKVKVEFAEPESDGDHQRPFAVLPVDEEAERQRMNRLERELTKLVQGRLVRLDVAQAFVVDLTPEQLRTVALLDEVECVRPNRTHRSADR